LPNESTLLLGVSEGGFYVNPEIALPGGLMFSPFASYMATGRTDNDGVDQGTRYQYGMSVRYSFGLR